MIKGKVVSVRWIHDAAPEVLVEYDTISYLPIWSHGSPIPYLVAVPDTASQWVEVTEEYLKCLKMEKS